MYETYIIKLKISLLIGITINIALFNPVVAIDKLIALLVLRRISA